MPHEAPRYAHTQRLTRPADSPVGEPIGGTQDVACRLEYARTDRCWAKGLRSTVDKFGADLLLEDLQHACDGRLRASQPVRRGAEASFFENPHECTQSVEVHAVSA